MLAFSQVIKKLYFYVNPILIKAINQNKNGQLIK